MNTGPVNISKVEPNHRLTKVTYPGSDYDKKFFVKLITTFISFALLFFKFLKKLYI